MLSNPDKSLLNKALMYIFVGFIDKDNETGTALGRAI